MSIKRIFVVLGIILTVSAFNIKPLRAGTIEISDGDIRSQKNFTLEIDLNMQTSFYSTHKDINVIAAITSLSMDDTLSFYFNYSILCLQQTCSLIFTFIRKTQTVNPQFIYSLTVDWFVGRGMRILDMNMSSYQEHLQVMSIDSYDENNKPQMLGMKLPYNNRDALRLLLIPNGWSNLTRTGRVMHLFAMGGQMYMYVVHYMEDEEMSGNHEGNSMGWPQGVDFIKYKILFFDYDYRPVEECKIDDQFKLFDNYSKVCQNGGSDLKWFYSFKRTRETSIQGQFYQQKAGYSFTLANGPAFYGVQGFPFIATDDFIDMRVHQYKYSKEFIIVVYISGILLLIGIVLSTVLGYKCWKRRVQKRAFKSLEVSYNATEIGQTPKSEINPCSPTSGMF